MDAAEFGYKRYGYYVSKIDLYNEYFLGIKKGYAELDEFLKWSYELKNYERVGLNNSDKRKKIIANINYWAKRYLWKSRSDKTYLKELGLKPVPGRWRINDFEI